MRQTYRIIPIYTGDVSGVCSALYELGGMVVIHDPSGCNSTYNTHDETRWYDKDSLIYISGLAERDAVLGRDEKFIHDVIAAAEELAPSFIALTNSPIPFMNGTDFLAIAKKIEKKTGIDTFYVPANGMHDYTYGAAKAYEKLLPLMKDKKIFERAKKPKVNILGMTPLDFDAEGSVKTIEELLCAHSLEVNCNLSMGLNAKRWREAINADVNLVLSSSGFLLAKQMKEKLGIPYVVGCPTGPFAQAVCKQLFESATQKISSIAYATNSKSEATTDDKWRKRNVHVILLGETVVMNSLAMALKTETNIKASVICPLEGWEALYASGNILTEGEEDLEEVLHTLAKKSEETYLVCDPLYQPIIPENMKLIALSHEGFSGRCFYKNRKNCIGEAADAYRYIIECLKEEE